MVADPPPSRRPERTEVALEHWQRLAEERTASLEALTRRPLVRALVSVERRSAPAVARARAAGRAARTATDRTSLALRAALAPGDPGQALRGVERAVASLPPVVAGGPTMEVVSLPDLGGHRVVLEAGRAVRDSTAEVVVLLPTGVRALPGAAERLGAEIDDTVVVATPTILHADRPATRATPHDGRVLAAGIRIADRRGVPVVEPIAAGSGPQVDGPSTWVPVALAAGLAIDRGWFERVGGFAPIDDLDAAAIELAARTSEGRWRVRHVPGAVVVDGRPVRSVGALLEPVDAAAAPWGRAIDLVGPLLHRLSAEPGQPPPLPRFAITIAAPSEKVAPRWGDLHLAEGLAGALRRLGPEVRVQTFDHRDDPAVRACDVHLVVRGLRRVRRTPGQVHVLWVMSHPETLLDQELHEADLLLVASDRLARSLAARTATPVEVFLQATDHGRFCPGPVDPIHAHPVTIVAKSRDQLRPMVDVAVRSGLEPAIYGGGWDRFVDPALVVADHVANEDLPVVYRSAGVVLNDHWDTMRADGFVSNRVFDVLACGTPVISDHLPEIAELLGDAVPTWSDPAELPDLVRSVLADPEAARARAARGRAAVLASHTFEHRAAQLLAVLRHHDLVAPAP